MSFTLSSNTSILPEYGVENEPALTNAVSILRRDLSKRFQKSGLAANAIYLKNAPMDEPEAFRLEVTDSMTLYAQDTLGRVYGLLYISEKFLDIRPFWFWMDQVIDPWPSKTVPEGVYVSPKPPVRYRGWFINDEVLISHWAIDGDRELPWRMALEALLRCGGNMVIPGTDKNSHKFRKLASDMGLWITHHHAEPLGAEMFLRAYPELEPDYSRYPALFFKLWEDAVIEQKDRKTVWTLAFRGQGDSPFWAHDRSGLYDTPEKRGRLISEIIELQRRLVLKYVDDPVFCTNLYGEIMELYAQGHISLDKDIILISADNGFGKMVSRRQGGHDPRVPSLPKSPVEHGGIYYHASFYDLQAANHVTMFPNTVDFVNQELDEVISKNASEYWIVNCSNVRPHVYLLDAIRKKWHGESVSDKDHSMEFAASFFGGSQAVALAYREYSSVTLPFGPQPDQHAGEQFYTENPRLLINAYIRGLDFAPGLRWLTGERALAEQVKYYANICRQGLYGLQKYRDLCGSVSGELDPLSHRLFDATLRLHASLHFLGARGVIHFGDGFELLEAQDHQGAFMAFGRAAECFLEADKLLRESEYGVWRGFYKNECLADFKHTAYMLQKLMGIVREKGDDPTHYRWYRQATFAPEDRDILTLLVHDNHMTDWELYLAFKEVCGCDNTF